MSSVWFVTPAFGRYGLTEVCLDERRRVCDYLAAQGVEARCVVVADDENLDIARSFGFDTVETANDWLGKKFNDGMQYAGRNGADWIVPIGSDSWIHPNYLLPLPNAGRTRTSKLYCAVTQNKLAELSVGGNGAGPYMMHRSLLQRKNFRPAADKIRKGVDTSTLKALSGIVWDRRGYHRLQYVGFRGKPHITSYSSLWVNWGKTENSNPWEMLRNAYPSDLVDSVMNNAKEWLVE